MPYAPPRVTPSRPRPAWHHATPVHRVRGRELQRRRRALFEANPLCVVCLEHGRIVVATIRDHVIPLAEGGRDEEANIQAICGECHDTKTQAESRRGRREYP
jgi:5-methylcytosine-specific restriction enzyme A